MRDLTVQVRRNTEDLQKYLRDLDQWTEEMQKKDEQLKSSKKQEPSEVANSPDVAKRKVAEDVLIAEEEAKSAPSATKRPKSQPLKQHEYDKWERFDVDKALEELDKEKVVETKADPAGADPLVLRQQAVVEKDNGNKHFKAGKWDEAIACYTRGIQCDPTNAMIPANRAMALLKKKEFAAAEVDCTVAIGLDSTYTKAYMRRGVARRELGKLEDAIKDLRKAVELEPANKQAEAELEVTAKLVGNESVGEGSRRNKKTKEEPSKNIIEEAVITAEDSRSTRPKNQEVKLEPGQILPIVKSPHARSKKPLKRIEIAETGDVDTRPDDVSTKEIKGNDVQIPPSQKTQEKEISDKLESTSLASSGDRFKKPQSSVQFMAVWKYLSESERISYLSLLSEADYPVIFRHSLEPPTFGGILITLQKSDYDPRRILEHLKGLTKVPRISAIIMFMDSNERELARDVLSRCKNLEKEALQPIITCFDL